MASAPDFSLDINQTDLPEETWQMRYPALARFSQSYVAVISAGVIILLVLTAIFGPILYPVSPTKALTDPTDPTGFTLVEKLQTPSWQHPAGTDFQSRDMLARLILGAQISLAVGFVSMFINLIIGVGVGTLAGWIGGKVDNTLMRIVDALYSIPLLLIVINLQLFLSPVLERNLGDIENLPFLLSPSLISIYIALGVSNWLTMARLTRAEVLNIKSKEFVMSSTALGASSFRTLFRHVLPNCLAPLIVAGTLAIPEAIFVEAFLSFIGIGVPEPLASWGSLAQDSLKNITTSHTLVAPALAISITMLAFNLFGDGLRDALDPKSRK
ncbi:MAG: ABC transporter permease [Sumerlaeia bacterium]